MTIPAVGAEGDPGALAFLAALKASAEASTAGLASEITNRTAADVAAAATATSTFQTIVRDLRPVAPFWANPKISYLETFQAGHGWAGSGTGTVADDVTSPALGSQSLKLTCTNATVQATITRTAFTLVGKQLAVLVKASATTYFSAVDILLASDAGFANYVRVNCVYPATLLQADTWQWVYFSLADLASTVGTPNLAAITTMRLRLNGNSAGNQVSLNINCLGTFDTAPAFPNGVVTLSFDDSISSQFTRAKPQMDLYGFAGNAFTIVDLVDSGAGLLTLQNLQDMQQNSHWEICGHAFTQAAHNTNYVNISTDALETELRSLKTWLVDNNFYRGADYLAWPGGGVNLTVANYAKKYFKFGRSVAGSPTPPPTVDTPMKVRCVGVGYPTSLATIQAYVDAAYTYGGWLILAFHDITASGASSATQWDVANFSSLMSYIAGKGMPVRTVDEVVRTVGSELSALTTEIATARAAEAALATVDTITLSNRLTTGEEAVPRGEVNNATTNSGGSGGLRLTYFTARKTESVSTVTVVTGTTPAGATPTLCRVGVWSIAANGTGTLVASSANDTTLFSVATTRYAIPLSAPLAKVAGQRYAIGVLVVTAATAPTFMAAGVDGSPGWRTEVGTTAPRMSGILSGLSDLPSPTFADGASGTSAVRLYAALS